MKEIRDWLNENGIKNPVGSAFTYNNVEHMLKNRRYIGELKFRDVVVPDAIPPIVSVELFDDVQEKMLKNKKAPARRKAEDDYLLTTKLHCGCCGALMFGESGTSRTGEVHRYYKCATAKKKKGCKKKTVRKLDMSLKDQRQALVDTFINSIYLYDDKVLITFNYKEGAQTITFENVAQATSKRNGLALDCIPAPQERQLFISCLFCFP